MNGREKRKGVSKDRAVSPVVGVALMVAVVVLLAAVVAAAVTGMGGNLNDAPRASIGFDYDNTTKNITIQHDSGDSLDADNLKVKIIDEDTGTSTVDPFTGTFATGDEVTYGPVEQYQTVKVVYLDDSGEQSAVLGEWEGPE